jgi:ketosteroid isomerase-like protein
MEVLTIEQVLIEHIDAVKSRNLSDIARDYADDAIFITATNMGDGILERNIIRGKEAIRSVFESVFTNILPEGSSMEFTSQIVEGEVAYITWSAKAASFNIPIATDTFVIRDGKIIVQTGLTILNRIA